MAAQFPSALASIRRIQPGDYMDGTGTELDISFNRLADEIEAIEARVGVTGSAVSDTVEKRLTDATATATAALPATQSAAGTLVAAATDKNTPADADSLALSDSAAASVLKKLTWSNLKIALASVFAKLAGTAGGQTLIGGTASGENLTLRSTVHATKGAIIFGSASEYDEANDRLGIGTLTPSAKIHAISNTEQLRLGYDASNYVQAAVSNTGILTLTPSGQTINVRGGSGIATLSANMVSNGDFASNLASWSDSGSSWSWSAGTALHTAGSASTLSQAFATTSGTLYAVRFNLTRTAGSVSVTLGADVIYNSATVTTFSASASYKRGLLASASSSLGLIITPSSDFSGSIDAIEIYAVTAGSVPALLKLQDSGGNTTVEYRHSPVSQYNTAIGNSALRSLVDANTISAFGYDAGRNVVAGTVSVMIGNAAAYSATYPTNAVVVGSNAAYSMPYPTNIVAIGSNAARYLADGATAYLYGGSCTYVGMSTKGSADGVTNENVFGYNATGIGSNSCVLGSSAVTKCQIFGDIILDKTVTAGGTTGAQTINKTVGSVNFAAGATSLVVTNSRVTTSSIIIATVATNDATMKTVVAVAAAGSFTLTANAAATAETRVNWIVIN